MSCLATLAGAPASRSLLPPRGRFPAGNVAVHPPPSNEERRIRGPDAVFGSPFSIAVVSARSRHPPERDVDQFRKAERLSVAGEVRDRRERGTAAQVVGAQVGRGVGEKEGGKHPGDEPASYGPQ